MTGAFQTLYRDTYAGLERLEAEGFLRKPKQAYLDRLDQEFAILHKVDAARDVEPGYGSWADFLLLTADYVNEARRRGVYVCPGRGSAAGALISYCVGITEVDPLAYGLLFERFLNPARVSAPDIDCDFSDQKPVFDYLEEKYGKNRVIRISAPSYCKPKSAIRKAALVKGVSFFDAEDISRIYERVEQEHELYDAYKDVDPKIIRAAVERSPELQSLDKRYPGLFDLACRFIGMLAQHGTHAAGCLITRDPAGTEVPVMRVGSKDSVGHRTAFDCKLLEAMGFIKLDILGVTNLRIIVDCLRMVEKRHGVKVDLRRVPDDDPKTAEVFSKGRMVGIFQLGDNAVAYQMAKDLPVETLEDVALINAAIRPGVDYDGIVANKRDPSSVRYPMGEGQRELLADSYGVFVYQEQIMRACRRFAGFTLAEADQVRRVVATTSNAALQYDIEEYRAKFLDGAVLKGHQRGNAEEVWGQIKALANYCFNKSHAVSYGMVSWQEAYLKARWPAEYLCAALNDAVRKKKKAVYERFVKDARAHGVKVKPPSVNHSHGLCHVDNEGAIVLGLSMIHGVGKRGGKAKEGAPYTDWWDLCRRGKIISKKVKDGQSDDGMFVAQTGNKIIGGELDEPTVNLIKAGALDCLYLRPLLLSNLYPGKPITRGQMATWERDALGMFLSFNPLDDYDVRMAPWIKKTTDRRKSGPGGGLVTEVRTTKKGHGRISVVTLKANMTLWCWANNWEKYRAIVQPGAIIEGELWKTNFGEYAIDGVTVID